MSLRADPQIGARRYLRGPALITVTPGLRIYSQYAELFSGGVLVRVLANESITARQLVGASQIVVVPRGLTSVEGEAPPISESPGVLYTSRIGSWNADGRPYGGGFNTLSDLYEFLRCDSFEVSAGPIASTEYNVAQPVPGTTPDGATDLSFAYTTGPLPVIIVAYMFAFDGIQLDVAGLGQVLEVSRTPSWGIGWGYSDPLSTDDRPGRVITVMAESYTYWDFMYATTTLTPLLPYLGENTYRSAIVQVYDAAKVRCYTRKDFAFGAGTFAPRQALRAFSEPMESVVTEPSPTARSPITVASIPEAVARANPAPRDPTGIMGK